MTYAIVLRNERREVGRMAIPRAVYEQLQRVSHLTAHGAGLDVTAETPVHTYRLSVEKQR